MSEQGLQKYQEGDYRSALSLYQAAYAKYPLAKLLYNIGRSQHKLGRLTEAEQAYRSFLVQSSDEELRQKAQGYLSEIEQERAQQQSSKTPLVVTTTPPPAVPDLVPPQPPTPTLSGVPAPPQTAAPEPMDKVPAYKKWWFWTAIGGGVVAVTAIGLGVGLSQRAPSIPSDPNTIQF